MNDFIWKKTAKAGGPNKAIMDFLAGEDVILDRQLISYDIQASKVHAEGLAEIGVLDEQEARRLVAALEEIEEQLAAGELELDSRYEDGHSALETWLTGKLGPLGGKIHTGRSRNDQVAVTLRLYLKDRLHRLETVCAAIASVLLERARGEGQLPMPGYTHLQRAMPSSAGLWLAGHAEAYIDNAELAAITRSWLDASPLGTASGFGVNLPLAREAAATRMGFARLLLNPQYAQNSRGKVELQALSALAAATLDLRRLAWDLSLFTTTEFGFVTLPDEFCTGSSMMPNKRNPDVIELMRACHGVVAGAKVELEAVMSLPSGYQRDLQATKPPVLRAFHAGLQALALTPSLLEAFNWNTEAMRDAISPEMFATEVSVELSLQGKPFREAYREVADKLAEMDGQDIESSLKKRLSPGACADLGLDILEERLNAIFLRSK